MRRLIDDLLSLSRIEMNRHVAPSAPVGVEGFVREALDGLRMVARDRGAAIEVAMVSGSAPGRAAITTMVGISTRGSAETGRKR